MRMKLVSLICLSGFMLFAGCRYKEGEKDVIRTIKTVVVKTNGDEKIASFPCKVKAASDIDLSFRISGPITKVNVTKYYKR